MAKGINKVITGQPINKEQISAFWSKVDIKDDVNSCWEWTGARKPKGYGNVRINKKYMLAHRVAFELTFCEIPKGMLVCHICDNPSCCNPRHLMLGSAAGNFSDMLIKGRQNFHKNKAIGERNANSKLTANKVREIRRMYAEKRADQYALAGMYSVSQTSISAIIRNQTWRHI